MKVLIVEDEGPIAEALAYNLRKEGYEVLVAETGEHGLSLARSEHPDLVILDVMLPKMDGIEVCRAIRSKSNIPIIMLTARIGETDKVVGLELGADDYVTKPFSTKELVARIKAVMRRSKPEMQKARTIEVGPFVIDVGNYSLRKNGETVSLTRREFALLHFLAEHPDQVFTRAALLDRVWGAEAYVEPHTVDVHVRWLRKKIEDDPSQPTFIETVRGVGYRFSTQQG